MKYVEPQITNVLAADSVIQSQVKGAPNPESDIELTTSGSGVMSDE